ECFQRGFDLVAVSGGKALRGPQSSGLLLGRHDLVAAAERAISPHLGIGRGMKVGKEEITGLLAAVERFALLDHDAAWRAWETRVAEMIDLLAGTPGAHARQDVPEISNRAPHLIVQWGQRVDGLCAHEVARRLWEGEPRIAVLAEGEHSLRV